jgi:hypothetical protein
MPRQFCWTVAVCPAMVNVPTRLATANATVKVTVPFPVPLAPAVMVMNGTLLVAVHAQPLPAVTVTVPCPPIRPIVCVVGEIENEHGGGALAACVTVNV